MEVSTGRFDRARRLADDELKIDPTDALADLVLLVDRLKAGDSAGAVRYASALPSDGIHRFIAPLALAWTRMAAGDLIGADTALQGLDKFNGFQLLKSFQLGLLYDFAGKADKAEEYYTRALGDGDQLNWRLTDVIANFYERHGQVDKAQALYQRFYAKLVMNWHIGARGLKARSREPMWSGRRRSAGRCLIGERIEPAETIDLALVYVRLRSRCSGFSAGETLLLMS